MSARWGNRPKERFQSLEVAELHACSAKKRFVVARDTIPKPKTCSNRQGVADGCSSHATESCLKIRPFAR